MPSEFVLILTTFPEDQDAEALAKALIDERLAACVNILPEMRSVYTWQGKTESAAERQLVIKTARSRVDALEARLKQLHPYDVPEFILIEIAGGSCDYLSWLSDSTR